MVEIITTWTHNIVRGFDQKVVQNLNLHHGDPERPPVTNPNSVFTNINIHNSTISLL